jgi:hypothetical protein
MRYTSLLLILFWTTQAHAASIWTTWELDLEGHAPPQYFLLSVTSQEGQPVPLAMQVPWASCTAVAGAQHCAQIGCPGPGTYDFVVQAQYEEGLSGPSNIATCRVTATQQCVCSTSQPSAPQQPAPPQQPTQPQPPVAQAPAPTTDIPPLPQRGPEGLNLQPIGELPHVAVIPAILGSGGT